ncbi:transcriptional regulator, GntR family [Streptomyces azureus]|uniref:Transcriptional regulator, GntR family n=1 Tax=Streptomyces azureus TaxID=146537 RepID=A0A0K8PYS0_STRAJ|nr:transcriptional regulator, GntR family [Streptomyces azureus]
MCVASNAAIAAYERIAAHDPSGAAQAMFTHITEAWLVRRRAPGDPVRLDRGKRHRRRHRVGGWLSRVPGGLGLPPSPPRRLRTGAGFVSRRQRWSVSRPGR